LPYHKPYYAKKHCSGSGCYTRKPSHYYEDYFTPGWSAKPSMTGQDNEDVPESMINFGVRDRDF